MYPPEDMANFLDNVLTEIELGEDDIGYACLLEDRAAQETIQKSLDLLKGRRTYYGMRATIDKINQYRPNYEPGYVRI